MGIELNIYEELANITVAATEAASVTRIIRSEIRNDEFLDHYEAIVDRLASCLDVIQQHLGPFAALTSQQIFMAQYDGLATAYAACYLKEISRPRALSDEAYEDYLLLQTRREFKTGFPLLKRTFERLEKFIDKWVTNDAWLAMSIDNLFKRMQRLFNEVTELKQKDPEDAFLIYQSAFADFADYLNLIASKREALRKESLSLATSEYRVLSSWIPPHD